MKTQEEIEQLAFKFYADGFLKGSFIHGYNQCQKDMVDKIKEAYEQGLKDGYACIPSMNSLKK